MNLKETNVRHAARIARIAKSLYAAIDKNKGEWKGLPEEAEMQEIKVGLAPNWSGMAVVQAKQLEWLGCVRTRLTAVWRENEAEGGFFRIRSAAGLPDTENAIGEFLDALAGLEKHSHGYWKTYTGSVKDMIQDLEHDGWRVEVTAKGRHIVMLEIP